MRACIVQGSQQIWVAALWYWGYTLNGAPLDYLPPWYIVLVLWPLAIMSFVFAYLMLYGLPGTLSFLSWLRTTTHGGLEYYRQTPPKVPNFIKTLLRRKLVLW
jgi:alpha-1,3-glucan synthase